MEDHVQSNDSPQTEDSSTSISTTTKLMPAKQSFTTITKGIVQGVKVLISKEKRTERARKSKWVYAFKVKSQINDEQKILSNIQGGLISQQEKQDFIKTTRYSFKKLILLNIRGNQLINLITGIGLMSVVTATCISPLFFLKEKDYLGNGFLHLLLWYFLVLLIGGLGIIVEFPFIYGLEISITNIIAKILCIGGSVIVLGLEISVFIYLQLNQALTEQNFLLRNILIALYGAIIFLLGIVINIALLVLAQNLYKRYKYNRIPNVFIIKELLKTLDLVLRYPERWTDIKLKKDIAFSLDKIVLLFEINFPNSLRTKDVIIDDELQLTFKRVAAAVRERKRWLLTPKSDTRDHFCNSLKLILFCVVKGNWDALPQADVPKLTKISILKKSVEILGAVFVAILPFTALYLFQKTPDALKGDLPQYLFLATIFWGILTLIFKMDPLVKDKYTVIKDILSKLPGVPKSGKE